MTRKTETSEVKIVMYKVNSYCTVYKWAEIFDFISTILVLRFKTTTSYYACTIVIVLIKKCVLKMFTGKK